MGGQFVRVSYFPCREVRAAQSGAVISRREDLGAVSDGVRVSSLRVSSLSHMFQMVGGHPVLEEGTWVAGKGLGGMESMGKR